MACCSFLVITAALAPASDRIPSRPFLNVLQAGEELLYEVSWSFFTIGTIRLKTLPSVSGNIHHADAYIDSYDNLPIVDIHAVISTDIDTTFLSNGARTYRRRADHWRGILYLIDRAAGLLFIDDVWQKTLADKPYERRRRDTLAIHDKPGLQDGLSILYFARAHARQQQSTVIPVISAGRLGSARFQFGLKWEQVDIDAVVYPVRTVAFEGELTSRGMYGISGDFRGWVSDDAEAIPIKAEMNVIIGKVHVELKEWTRPGWLPPR